MSQVFYTFGDAGYFGLMKEKKYRMSLEQKELPKKKEKRKKNKKAKS